VTVHRFSPSVFHRTMGPHPPALRVCDGDTIVTQTVDSMGRDQRDEAITAPGNPQTGPFYVEGAEPGDTLLVRFDRIVPNRRTGWSYSLVQPTVLDPTAASTLPPDVPAAWAIDTDRGTVMLVSPESSAAPLRLPLRAMLGCFGVAPPLGQTVTTATAGSYGGNMDYPGFVSGVVVHLPVVVPGALLFVGDGHAAQGDGEITGTGVEVSCDVELTVRVRKHVRITAPRAEDPDYLFTVGNARPLEECVQQATSEMLRWLQQDHCLGGAAAHLLMGAVVRYEFGNLCNLARTVVCKIPKSALAM
jgi:amidase